MVAAMPRLDVHVLMAVPSNHNRKQNMLTQPIAAFIALLVPLTALVAGKPIANNTGLEFIDTSFENASPLWHEFAADNSVQVHLLYGQQRNSPNRAAGHFHFLLPAKNGLRIDVEGRAQDCLFSNKNQGPLPRG